MLAIRRQIKICAKKAKCESDKFRSSIPKEALEINLEVAKCNELINLSGKQSGIHDVLQIFKGMIDLFLISTKFELTSLQLDEPPLPYPTPPPPPMPPRLLPLLPPPLRLGEPPPYWGRATAAATI